MVEEFTRTTTFGIQGSRGEGKKERSIQGWPLKTHNTGEQILDQISKTRGRERTSEGKKKQGLGLDLVKIDETVSQRKNNRRTT